ncbi:MAG: hypothetical protein KGN84_05850, partial [Acidobacteriota bacterium]|nr:hypothetical protein [Acidobacteriota bacterium]
MKCVGFDPESYAFYVLGTAPEQDAAQIARHLEMRCERCISEIAAYERVWGDVALATPRASAPAGLREKILDRVRATSVAEARPKRKWRLFLAPALAGACVAAAIAIAGIAWIANRRVLPNIVYSPRMVVTTESPPAPPSPAPPPASAAPRPEPSDALLAELRAELDAEKQKSAQLEARLRTPPPQPPAPGLPAPQPPAPQVRPVENAAELQRLRDRVNTLEHQVSQYRTLLDIERRRA